MNEKLFKLYEWLNSNSNFSIRLNLTFVIFHRYQREQGHEVNLKIFDNNSIQLTSLEGKTYIKYLGVLIDGSLSWKYHIDYSRRK